MGVNLSFVWKEESNFIRLQDVRGTLRGARHR